MTSIPVFIVCLIVGGLLKDTFEPALVLSRVLATTALIVGGFVLPLLRWRTWRYELREEEIDLLHGAVIVTRTLIPTVRVQHVGTRRTWFGDIFGLSSLVIHTAGGSHTIPGLPTDDAAAIRDRVALLAREPDDG